jgi:heme exporter protein A
MQNTTHPEKLACEALTLWRGDRCLFNELSFQIGAGAAALIRGPNGSGKTSLLRVVCGLSPPEQGAVHWMGTAIQQQRQAYAKALAYSGHIDGLNAELTPLENLAFFCALRGTEPASGVANLSGLGLDACAGLPVRALSAGQRRRAGLARVLAADVRLWVLDEPFTNLDGEGRRYLTDQLVTHLGNGGMAVIASHQDLDVPAEQLRSITLGGTD